MGKKIIGIIAAVLILVLVVALLLQGRSGKDEDFEPVFIDIELTITPEEINVNDTVTFDAKVTYGDEVVEDADEVVFEIWRAHDEEHETVEVEHMENGIYRLEKSFDREGTYYIITHVTAKDMHYMPKREFVVGEPSEPETDENSSSQYMNAEDFEEE